MGCHCKCLPPLIVVLLFASFLLKHGGNGATIPANPCPNLFQYFQNNGIVYGRMEFPNDLSWFYTLNVNMSIATYLSNDKNIRLELKSNTHELLLGRPVVYDVIFPVQNVLPKPTRIEFNGRVYCAGPPETIRPGGYVTNMWASTFYRITNPIRPPKPNSVPDIEIQRLPEVTPFFDITLPTQPSSGINPFFTIPPTSSSFFTLPTVPPNIFVSPSVSTSTKATVVTDKNHPIEEQECGQPLGVLPLIINGEDVGEGQYPWLAAIMYKHNAKYKYKCSGSLISKRHVITAAHCVQYFNAPLFPVNDLLLVFGTTNIKNWENGGQTRQVEKVKAHPDYQQNKGDADIAMITLKENVQFTFSIRHICLWEGDDNLNTIVGESGTVVGWGRDETGLAYAPDAKGITLPIVSQATCLRSDPGFLNLTSTRTFCAGRRNGAGPCNGDSGSGFVMFKNGRWVLRGVVSAALRDVADCDLSNYFVFADVSKVLDWIKKAMA